MAIISAENIPIKKYDNINQKRTHEFVEFSKYSPPPPRRQQGSKEWCFFYSSSIHFCHIVIDQCFCFKFSLCAAYASNDNYVFIIYHIAYSIPIGIIQSMWQCFFLSFFSLSVNFATFCLSNIRNSFITCSFVRDPSIALNWIKSQSRQILNAIFQCTNLYNVEYTHIWKGLKHKNSFQLMINSRYITHLMRVFHQHKMRTDTNKTGHNSSNMWWTPSTPLYDGWRFFV